MKTIENKSKKIRLIKLQILKSKIYKKEKLFDIQSTELQVKKLSEILYKYNLNNQRILFLGFPKSFEKIILKTKHFMFAESSWLNGFISNQSLRHNYKWTEEQKRLPFKNQKLLLRLKKRIDLIVVFNLDNTVNALSEGYNAKIPTIAGVSSELLENIDCIQKISYKVRGRFIHSTDRYWNSNFFISFLKTILKKSIKNFSKKFVLKYSKWVYKITKKRKRFNKKKRWWKASWKKTNKRKVKGKKIYKKRIVNR